MKKRILGLISALMLTTGCSIHVGDEYEIKNKGDDSTYETGDRYIPETFTDIDINWPVGRVEIREIVGFNEPGTQFYERWRDEANECQEDITIHWKKENGKLTISPAKSGTYKPELLDKDLYLFLQADSPIHSLKIDSVKATIDSSMVGDKTTINAVSSDINFYSDYVKDMRINNVSGNANLSFKDFDSVVIDTVSADTVLNTKKDKEVHVDVDSISGAKTLNDVVESSIGKKVELNSVSGSITINGNL